MKERISCDYAIAQKLLISHQLEGLECSKHDSIEILLRQIQTRSGHKRHYSADTVTIFQFVASVIEQSFSKTISIGRYQYLIDALKDDLLGQISRQLWYIRLDCGEASHGCSRDVVKRSSSFVYTDVG